MNILSIIDELAFIIVNRINISDSQNYRLYILEYIKNIDSSLFDDIKDINDVFKDFIYHDEIYGIKRYFESRINLESSIKQLIEEGSKTYLFNQYLYARNTYVEAYKSLKSRNLYQVSGANFTCKKGDIKLSNELEYKIENMKEFAAFIIRRGNPFLPLNVESCLGEYAKLCYKESGFKNEPYLRKFYDSVIFNDKGLFKELFIKLVSLYMYFNFTNEYNMSDEIRSHLKNALNEYYETYNLFMEEQKDLVQRNV